MKYQKLFAFAAAVSTATALACSQASTSPTAPAGTSPGFIAAGPDGATLKATAPAAVSPVGGVETTDLSPELVVTNGAGIYVSNLPLSYVFEVMNQAGSLVYRSNPIPAGANGRTTHEMVGDLNNDETHTWRAFAVYQGQRGPLSTVASFRTLNRFGVSCAHLGDPLSIVACRFEQHGGMDHEETVEFMKEVAYDLNQTGISDHGGFGILVKTVGNNCNGYSCDIICEGHGSDQNQYDILIDDAIPNWAQVDNPTVRPCEIIDK
jgi:hypothetical protein